MDDSSSNVETPVVTTDMFRMFVREFIQIHDRLADIRKETSGLNKRKKKLTESIVSFMKTQNKEFCNL